MKHEIHYIKSFNIVWIHKLEVVFENNRCMGPLKDPEFFKQVKLDDEVNTLVWPNGADFDPSMLHHWDQNEEKLSCRA